MNRLKNLIKQDSSMTILICFALFILVFLGITLGSSMYNARNMSSMAFQVSEFAILSLGMTLVMLLGGIDLSIVANANLSGIIAGYVMTGKLFDISNMNISLVVFIAVVSALIISTLLGLINGIIISKTSAPPLVATLGTMTLYNGIGMAITSGQGVVGFPELFLNFGSGSFLKIPYVFLILVVISIALIIFMGKTTLGRKLYIIGENHTASRFSAIDNEKIIMVIYALAGLLAGIASLIIICRVNSAKVGYGDTYLLQAILVAVLGGISPSGGKGKIFGVIIAVCSLQMLQSAFTQWQFSPYSKKLIWGIMLLFVMVANMLVERYGSNFRINKHTSPKQVKGVKAAN